MGASLAPEIAACGIRGWKIWDKSEISRMLDAAGPVRNRYIAEIAPADILNRLHEYNPALSTRLNELFKTQIVNELRAEQWVRLSQFENADQAKLPLSRVGVDLPIKGQTTSAARMIIESADKASPFGRPGDVSNILLLGGPGQGKSTIAQLIGQCYRIALLEGSLTTGQSTYSLVQSLKQGFQRAGIPLPRYRRWPVRIDLASYVDSAVNYRQTSLVSYVAEQADRRAKGISGPKVKNWLRAWPWMLIRRWL